VRLRQQHPGDEVGVGAGESGELGAEIGIASAVRRSRAVNRQVRRQGSTRVKPEPSRPERIVRAERGSAFEDLYQLQTQAAGPQRPQPHSQRLAVERMGQPDLLTVRCDQPMRLGLEQRLLGRQRSDLRQRERLAEREQFDRVAVIGRKAVHSLADQVDQRRTRRGAAIESPEPG
jgi:hypothetical protein